MTKIIALVCLCSLLTFGQTATQISAFHYNDANGVVKDTGKVFIVTGVVIATNQLGTSGAGAITNDTAAIAVYGSAFASASPALALGDTVTVQAKLTSFAGMAELDLSKTTPTTLAKVTKINSGPVPAPWELTIPQIMGQAWNGYEPYENGLAIIKNVTFVETGTFASGTSYHITDGTNTFPIFINKNVTSIISTPIPTVSGNITGLVSQHSTAVPYNASGYQLIPRAITDLYFDATPVIYSNLFVNSIDTASFTVNFQTARNGNSQIKYGLTQTLTDSVVINKDTTIHIVQVFGLKPGTLYYFQVLSKNAAGTSVSSMQQVTTASNIPTLGAMNVYFNQAVDTTIAIRGNAAKGSVNFEQALVNRINNATYSIDIACYSLNGLSNLTNAIVNAKNRGLKIRFVYDSGTLQSNVQTIVNAGVPIIQRPASLTGIMHNKFFVFDHRDSNPANDWVWTGSWNPNSAEATWKNNAIEINDPALAAAYQTEFEEMWGSTTETPNATTAKFSSQKSDNTPHSFTIGGKPVQLYFSPTDGTTGRINTALATANSSIHFAVMSFTRSDLASTISARKTAGATDVKGVMDDVTGTGNEFAYLGGFCDVHANTGGTLHDKYAIVDANNLTSNPMVITGSHNWSSAAESSNDENTLIISDGLIANQYLQDFKARYNAAGGTGTFVVPTAVNDKSVSLKDYSVQLYQNYPNPFNPVTTIRFESTKTQDVKVEVYNALGQNVGTLFNQTVHPGIYAIDFNSTSLKASSGIYYYRLTAGGFSDVKKMILMK